MRWSKVLCVFNFLHSLFVEFNFLIFRYFLSGAQVKLKESFLVLIRNFEIG